MAVYSLIIICLSVAALLAVLLFKQIIPHELALVIVILSFVSFVPFYQISYNVQQSKDKQKTIINIDSVLKKNKSAKVILDPQLCNKVRKHYVRQFESTTVVKGSDCESGLLVITKNKTEGK